MHFSTCRLAHGAAEAGVFPSAIKGASQAAHLMQHLLHRRHGLRYGSGCFRCCTGGRCEVRN
jgi:hypothetical protein